METVAELIDKLIVVNIKIFNLEGDKRDGKILDNHKKLADNIRLTNYLNTERNNLMTEIDEKITETIENFSKKGITPRIHNNVKIY